MTEYTSKYRIDYDPKEERENSKPTIKVWMLWTLVGTIMFYVAVLLEMGPELQSISFLRHIAIIVVILLSSAFLSGLSLISAYISPREPEPRNYAPKTLKAFEDGLKIGIKGKAYFVPWGNTIEFRWRTYGEFKGWGILIDNGMTGTTLMDYDELHDFIPLSHFVQLPGKPKEGDPVNLEHFKKTPLGEDLYYYAPHLFDAPKYKNERIEEIIQHGAAALQQNSTSTSGGK